MKSSRQRNMGWGFSLVILCVAIILAPRSYAHKAGHNTGEYGTVIGIDIGSETSRVGIIRDKKFEVLHHIPSCVAFTDQGVLVGDEAKLQRPDNPSRTICDVRMLLGQRWSDSGFQETIKNLHCRVQGKEDRPVITVNIQGREHTFTPEHIAGLIMSKLRDTAAAKLGEDVGHAVVTVPTGFNDNQRQAVKDAGATVGLNVLRIINESTAAVIAYELDRSDEERNVVVLDFGASKTDVTVANIDYGVIETLATVSMPISGRLFNRQLGDYIAAQCSTEGVLLDQQARINLEDCIEANQRNRTFGRSAYCLKEDFLKHCPGLTSPKITHSTRDMDKGLTDSVLEPLKRVLDDLNMIIEWEEGRWFSKKDMLYMPYMPSNISNVNKVVAVGGFSKSPMVTWLLGALLRNDSWTDLDFDADEAVVRGAAIQAQVLSGEEGTTTCYMFYVTDLSVGLETSEGYMDKVIRRSTPLPTRKIQNLTTAYDNQDSMVIRVFEGDRMMAGDNYLLGEVKLTVIPHAPRHVPIIEVSFEYDYNYILELKVSARCLGTNIEASAIFNNTAFNRGLRDTDFERLISEAQLEFEDTEPISNENLERHIGVVSRIIDRDDVIDAPDTVHVQKKEAQKVVQEAREWLATQPDASPSTELNRHKSILWDVARKLLEYNPAGRMYSVGSQQHVDRAHDGL